MNHILTIALLTIGMAVHPATGMCRDAALQQDSLVLQFYFRHDDDLLVKDYRGNTSMINRLAGVVDKDSIERISIISIVGSASPDGNPQQNEILALKRAKSVRNFVYWKAPTLDRNLVRVAADTNFCAAWLRAVERDTLVPRRDRVLEILRSEVSIMTKWATIKQLQGDVAQYLERTIFPYLRNSVSCVVRLKPAAVQQSDVKIAQNSFDVAGSDADKPAPVESHTPSTAGTTASELAGCTTAAAQTSGTAGCSIASTQTPATAGCTTAAAQTSAPTDANTSQSCSSFSTQASDLGIGSLSSTAPRRPLFALKTNLLFDAATMLNLELEVPIGQRWSVAGEVIVPWWLAERKQHCLQLMSGNIEGKYWFGNRQNRPLLTGWFAGLYAGGGYYDLEWDRTGYQGEFFIALGVSGGYAHTINRRGNLRMEYTLGIGYMQTDYRKYEAKIGMDDAWHLYRRESGTFKWFGPTRLKISLVWMLDRKGKGGSK